MHMGRPRRKADGRRSRQLARQSLHLAEIGHLNQQTLVNEAKNVRSCLWGGSAFAESIVLRFPGKSPAKNSSSTFLPVSTVMCEIALLDVLTISLMSRKP